MSHNDPEFRARLRRVLDQARELAAKRVDGEGFPVERDAFNADIDWLEERDAYNADSEIESLGEPALSNVLREADRLTSGDRRAAYDHPLVDFTCTASIIDALLARTNYSPGEGLDPRFVPLFMIGVKLSRLAGNIEHRDSLVDIAGYARTLEMVQERLADVQNI